MLTSAEVLKQLLTLHVHYPIDGVDTSGSSRKHANATAQGSNELISVLGNDSSFDQVCNFLWRKAQQAAKDRIIVGAQRSREALDGARGAL